MQSNTFGGLAAYRQFILYIAVPDASGKTQKYPIDPRTGQMPPKGSGGAHDPSIWLSCDEALALVARGVGHGVGFVFTANDPFFFLDIDKGRTASGEWCKLAQDLCDYFAGCFVEVSLSGTGLHVIGSGTAPTHSCTPPRELKVQLAQQYGCGLELYTSGRFCALTGSGATGTVDHVAQAQLEWLCASYFPARVTAEPAEWSDGPCPEYGGPADDDELIARMLAARGSIGAAFGTRATVRELWEADGEVLGRYYPPQKDGQLFNHSDADCALCQHLAFWTGRDCERMDRLFRLSGLYRDKWDRGDGYGRNTVTLAATRCSVVYTGKQRTDSPAPTAAQQPPAPAPLVQPGAEGDAPEGSFSYQFMGVTQQVDHFKGCVYVRDSHRVWVPDGALLKPEQFRATYGGHVFALDYTSDKTTRNAWECFTESQSYRFPRAHECCFRPECAPGAIIKEEGYELVNTYVPIETRRVQGDPTPFLQLVGKLLPIERDRNILLTYMAALVQNPGRKFQWWPVIQGVEGNGKSAINRVLNHCVGNRYSHLPNPDAMAKSGNQFNAWVERKLFLGIEEIYVPERRDFLETIKTLVTNARIQIEGKGANQIMGDNRCNGVMCTNHKDGVPITVDGRRYAVFYTAQQSKEDKLRDGMTGSYFPELYDWFNGTGAWAACGPNYGYAVVNDYLRRFTPVAEFNPAGICQEAPVTSSTPEALRCSMGSIEQEVLEAVDEGRPGFAGGWISSKAFDMLLENRRAARSIPPARRRQVLQGLGYDWHPSLRDGRVCNPIPDPAGHGKPRLYVKRGHLALNLHSAAEIARAYLDAQQSAGTGVTAIFGANAA